MLPEVDFVPRLQNLIQLLEVVPDSTGKLHPPLEERHDMKLSAGSDELFEHRVPHIRLDQQELPAEIECLLVFHLL